MVVAHKPKITAKPVLLQRVKLLLVARTSNMIFSHRTPQQCCKPDFGCLCCACKAKGQFGTLPGLEVGVACHGDQKNGEQMQPGLAQPPASKRSTDLASPSWRVCGPCHNITVHKVTYSRITIDHHTCKGRLVGRNGVLLSQICHLGYLCLEPFFDEWTNNLHHT